MAKVYFDFRIFKSSKCKTKLMFFLERVGMHLDIYVNDPVLSATDEGIAEMKRAFMRAGWRSDLHGDPYRIYFKKEDDAQNEND